MKSQPNNFRDNERGQKFNRSYLYIFNYEGELFHLTSFDRDLVVTGLPGSKGTNPQTFTRAQIRHTPVEQSTELNAPKMTITVGINSSDAANALKKHFVTAVVKRLDVTVVQINSAALISGPNPGAIEWTTDCYTLFRGVKMSLAFGEYQIILGFINLMLQEDGKVPRYYYQKLCQHSLYSPVGCKLDPTDANNFILTTALAVDRINRWVDINETAINGHNILLANEVSLEGGFLNELDGGGNIVNQLFIVANTDYIPGVVLTPVRIYLLSWSATLVPGRAIRVQRGCRRTKAACTALGNLPNYGGMPYIADSNPAVDGLST